ncbi:hypothetical protein [Frankia sp. QA3]|uniref:hypothetical protein n=1 Tax=Frankia sp. QA3 TaxID=710111 RepID=UPI000269C7C6|nr:hypothetical protein [Frankia sp. QA3]EIV94979.1 hypothetical protein FraQA3DRAFT_4778 [Frankia sp. QA3]
MKQVQRPGCSRFPRRGTRRGGIRGGGRGGAAAHADGVGRTAGAGEPARGAADGGDSDGGGREWDSGVPATAAPSITARLEPHTQIGAVAVARAVSTYPPW